ncbi:MAG: penicillin-binding protein [Erysipelotrichaceae bacterium]|nr:penicillin-binding protein [Erysipelotrichaceae bacterium]
MKAKPKKSNNEQRLLPARSTLSKKNTKMSRKKILNSLLIVFLSLVFIGGVCVFFVLVNIMREAPNLSKNMFNSQDSSKILASNNETLTEVGMEARESITYEQLPQTVIDAFLSIEDSRYFTHNGFDLPRFVKSAFNNLRNGDLGQGGSTLTMQMVDNVRKDNPDYDETSASSWQRIEWKIQEIFLSMQVENTMSKEEILTKYLNKVNFGNTARGIQKGSQYYFGKDVSQLNLSESAFLAGVVNAPNLFNPYKGTQWSEYSKKWVNYYEYAIERRDDTLYQMLNHGYISEEEYQLAKNTELAFQLQGERFFHNTNNDTILDLVRKEAAEKYGINIYTDSVIVHTSIDLDAQKKADEITSGSLINLPNKESYQLGTTMLNSQTGEIVAAIAGRHFSLDDEKPINQSLETHQTGSTIKPLLDYAPGFDVLGYATSHTFADVPVDIYGDGRPVNNSNGQYKGDVEFVEAVGQSYNTTASQSLKDVLDTWGEDNIKEYMLRLGFNKEVVDKFNLQFGIGGADMVASPQQMAAAYAVFANEGKYIEPHIITKIEFPNDPDKKPIEADFDSVQTISSQAAYLMSDILQKATSNNFFMSKVWPQAGYPVYGKTGTSDWGDSGVDYGIPKGAIHDEWMANYTNKYVVVTWEGHIGYDYINNDLLYQNIPGQVNRALMDVLAAKETPEAIKNPGDISTISHIKGKFPYAAPNENTPKDMVVTGMVKSDKAKMEKLTADKLSDLSKFTLTLQNDAANTIHLSFTPYPEADKLVAGSHTKEYNLLGVKFTGNVYYTPTLLFGRVIYKADVKINNSVVQSISANDAESNHVLNVGADQTIKVCGYYTYEHADVKSNEICVNATTQSPQTPTVDTSALSLKIAEISQYADTSKYKMSYVSSINRASNSAYEVLMNPESTQEEIDEQVAILQALIDESKNYLLE